MQTLRIEECSRYSLGITQIDILQDKPVPIGGQSFCFWKLRTKTAVFLRTLPCCKLAKIGKNDAFLLNMKRFEGQVKHVFIR